MPSGLYFERVIVQSNRLLVTDKPLTSSYGSCIFLRNTMGLQFTKQRPSSDAVPVAKEFKILL